jgi:hypothetical protein
MFAKAFPTRLEAMTIDPRKAVAAQGFGRPAPAEPAAPLDLAEESSFAADPNYAGFERFGRGGLELGGLHRDQQWVGAWGGRC